MTHSIPMVQDEVLLIHYHLPTGRANAVLNSMYPCLESSGDGSWLFYTRYSYNLRYFNKY